MKRLDFTLPFKTLAESENLYDGIDLDSDSICDAEYLKRDVAPNNPDLCAIPRNPSPLALMNATTIRMNYSYEAASQMPKAEKFEAIGQLDNVMTPIGLHIPVARAISDLLLTSYSSRDLRLNPVDSDDGMGMAVRVESCRRMTAPRPRGFFLYGKTGCGKSISVRLICNLYPRAIRHTLDGYSYIQIPIIRITAQKHQMKDVYRSIAAQIDEILSTGHLHEAKLRSKTLTDMEGIFKIWIKKYHIGLLLIDEIQFLNLSPSVDGKSVEDMIAISEETGISLGFIGNNDAKVRIFSLPRLYGRIALSRIDADNTSENDMILFHAALEQLWCYQWTDVYTPLTKDIKQQLIYESAGNMCLLKYTLMLIQSTAVTDNRKAPLTLDYITHIIEQSACKMRQLLMIPSEKSDEQFHGYIQHLQENLVDKALQEEEEDKRHLLEEFEQSKIMRAQNLKKQEIAAAIQLTTDGYTEAVILNAIGAALDKEPSLIEEPKILTQKVLAMLKSARSRRKRERIPNNHSVNNRKADELVQLSLQNAKGEGA